MNRNHLIPKQIVDRNGKTTTVRVKPTSAAPGPGSALPAVASVSNSTPRVKTNPQLDALIDEFATMSAYSKRTKYAIADLADPEFAADHCASATGDFHQHIKRNRPIGPAGFVPGARILTVHWEDGGVWHRANLVDDYVIDWTARQFDPTAAWPLVEPLEHYLERCTKAQDFHEPEVVLLPPEVAQEAVNGLYGYLSAQKDPVDTRA